MKWKVRYSDYQSQFRKIESQLMGTIHRVLSRGDLVEGEQRAELEASLAQLTGNGFGFAMNGCNTAFSLTLQAYGVGEGDDVITTSRCHPTLLPAVLESGARPVLVDVKEDSTMSADALAEALNEKTKVVIPTHCNGRAADIAKICELAEQSDCVVIEDATSALGAELAGRPVGSFGAATVFDLGPSSLVSGLADGGAVVVRDEEIAGRLDGLYKSESRGSRKSMNNLLAAVVDIKLKHLPDELRRRRELAAIYQRALRRVSDVIMTGDVNDRDRFDVFHRFEIQTPFRNDLSEFLNSREVEHELPQPLGRMANAESPEARPISKQIQRTAIYLPIHPELTSDNVEFVAQSVEQFHRSQKGRKAA